MEKIEIKREEITLLEFLPYSNNNLIKITVEEWTKVKNKHGREEVFSVQIGKYVKDFENKGV